MAAVVRDGYAAARIADLVEISGVSRRSFYDLFPDKEACLLATLEALHALAAEKMQAPRSGSWEERVFNLADRLSALIAAQPAAARLCLVDGYGGGAGAVAEVQRATARLGSMLEDSDSAEAPAGMPPEMADVMVGAMLTVARRWLLSGQESDLSEPMSQTMHLLLAISPPPEPLRPVPRSPAPAAETIDAPDYTERILRALVVLAAENGYERVTINQIVKRAAIAPSTFYAHFSGKEEVLMAALDNAGAQMVAAILPAFRRHPEWPAGVHAAFAALFGFLASRPALARLLLLEVYAAGPAAIMHRGLALRPLEVLFAEGRRGSPAIPASAMDALEGGITSLAAQQVLAQGTRALPALTPFCTYLTLAPFIGVNEACAVANADPQGRPWKGAASAQPARFPTGQAVLNSITPSPQPVPAIAKKVGQPEDVVARELGQLLEAQLVEVDEPGENEGSPRYRSVLGRISTPVWQPMSLTERNRISAQVGGLIERDVRRAVDAGTFDARVERQLTRVILQLDERGWQELSAAHDKMLEREMEIGGESAERLAETGDLGIEARSIRTLFELPRSPDVPR